MVRTRLLARAILCAPLAACDGADPLGANDDIFGCSVAQNYAIGSTVSGNLSSSDCEHPDDGSPLDLYRFTVSQRRAVTITMRSNVVDSYMFLLTENGNTLDENDDGDPQSAYGAQISAVLEPGTYYIAANTFEGEYGSYTLTSN